MEYRIKDIAKALNLSKQMIRYYEQCGVITPERQENNYRLYTSMDYFALSEAVALSRFQVNIGDICTLKAEDYCAELSRCYRNYIKSAGRELQYKTKLLERAEELLARTETAEMNVGHVWIRRIPAHRLYPLMKSHNDQYGEIELPKEVEGMLNSSDILPFCDGVIEVNEEEEQWWLSVKETYVDTLRLPDCQEAVNVEERFCACVIFNMGKIGEFHADRIRGEIGRICQSGYEIDGKPRSVLLCRGSQDHEFRRLLELQVPIR